MNVSNHMITGAAIALTVKQPYLVLPLAFLSHFILDALPHYGFERQGFHVWMQQRSAGLMIVFDAACVTLVLFSLLYGQHYFALLAAFVAVSPDTTWIYRYIKFERKRLDPAYYWFNRFHLKIQWCERRWGIYVEILFFIGVFVYTQWYLINR